MFSAALKIILGVVAIISFTCLGIYGLVDKYDWKSSNWLAIAALSFGGLSALIYGIALIIDAVSSSRSDEMRVDDDGNDQVEKK